MIMSKKYSKEWATDFKKTLEEKYLYLLESELVKLKYEILFFQVDEIIMNGDRIDEISLDIKVDYLGPCDGEASDLTDMIEKVSNDVHHFFSTWHPDPTTFKMSKKNPGIVSEPFFLKINYNADELHSFLIYIRLNYDTL